MRKILLTLSIITLTSMVIAQQPDFNPYEGGAPSPGGEIINAPTVACDNEKGFYDFPFTENGITVTGSGTGSYMVYAPGWGSCGIFAGANCVWIGSGGPGTYTNTFSSPVNNMIYNITAMDADEGGEIITITTDAGTPSITYTDGSCSADVSIVGNVINCIAESQSGGAGGRFLVNSTSDFTSITFSINGGLNGTTMTMCFDQAVTPPPPVDIPLSNWALFLGIGLVLIFAVIRFRRLI